jgi:hypothetical protein
MEGHRGFSLQVVRNRLLMVGISRPHAELIAHRVSVWIRSNGVLWTIDRLKQIKLCYIASITKQAQSFPWLKRNRNGLPAGEFSLLRKYPLKVRLFALNLEKTFVLSRPSKAQRTKFLDSVNCEPPMTVYKSFVGLGMKGLNFQTGLDNTKPSPIAVIPAQVQKRDSVEFHTRTFINSEDRLQPFDRLEMVLSAAQVLQHPMMLRALYPYVGDIFYPLTLSAIEELRWKPEFKYMGDNKRKLVAGCIAGTQEPGGKLRVFAAPNLVLQSALEPLEKWLFSVLAQIPTDCTKDQSLGARRIKERLKEGQQVYCYDLSNATDRFPLSLQLHVLREAKVNRFQVSAFEYISGLPWNVDSKLQAHGFPDTIRWSTGQPLGLRGSFPLFALTHNLLLRGIEHHIHGEVKGNFVVLGDDVAIWDAKVAHLYKRVLTVMGVPISVAKSIESDLMAEFAGYYITRRISMRATKHRKLTRNNVRSYAQSYGKSSEEFITPYLPGCLTALTKLPKSIGGLGFESAKSLDELFETSGDARVLFGALVYTMHREEGLPERMKSHLWEDVYSQLGFSRSSFQDWLANQRLPDLLLEPSNLLRKFPLSLVYSHLFLAAGDRIAIHERKACESLWSGKDRDHLLNVSLVQKYETIRNVIRSRYAVPDCVATNDDIANIMSAVESYKKQWLRLNSTFTSIPRDVVAISEEYSQFSHNQGRIYVTESYGYLPPGESPVVKRCVIPKGMSRSNCEIIYKR